MGDEARHLPFEAIGIDGERVTQLRGQVRVLDSAVATLEQASIRPRAVGETHVLVQVGNRTARIRIFVHEQVRGFTGLRNEQRLVAIPVVLRQGDTTHCELPDGNFWLKYIPGHLGEVPPTITLSGHVGCSPVGWSAYLMALEHRRYCVRQPGRATVTVAHGRTGAPAVEGWLALERGERR
jgi:hypothetical protein